MPRFDELSAQTVEDIRFFIRSRAQAGSRARADQASRRAHGHTSCERDAAA
jgi:hypothetical protein